MDGFAGDHAVQCNIGARQAGAGRAIVAAAQRARQAGTERFGGDAGAAAGRYRQAVVRQRGARAGGEIAGRQAGRHAVGGGHIDAVVDAGRLRDTGRLRADKARQAEVAGTQQGTAAAVIGLADGSRQAGAQGFRRDAGAAAGHRRQDIVGQRGAAACREIGAGQAGADAVRAQHIGRVVQARRLADAGRLAADQAHQLIIGAVQHGRRIAVVDLAHTGDGGGQRLGRDAAGAGGRYRQDIVAGKGSRAGAEVAGGQGGADAAGADVARVEQAAGIGDAERFRTDQAAQYIVAACQSGGIVGVIHLAHASQAGRQGLGRHRDGARRVAAQCHRIAVVAGRARQVDRDGVRAARDAGIGRRAGGRCGDDARQRGGHRVAQIGAGHRRLRAGQADHAVGQGGAGTQVFAIRLADVLRADGDGGLVGEQIAVACLRDRGAGIAGVPDGRILAVQAAIRAAARRIGVHQPARSGVAHGDAAGAIAGIVVEIALGGQGHGRAGAAGAQDRASVQRDVGADAAITEVEAAAVGGQVWQVGYRAGAIALIDQFDGGAGDAVDADGAGHMVGLVAAVRHQQRYIAGAGVDLRRHALLVDAHAEGGDAGVAVGVVDAVGQTVVGGQVQIAVARDDVSQHRDAAPGLHGQRAAGHAAGGVDAAFHKDVVIRLQGHAGARFQHASDIVGGHGLGCTLCIAELGGARQRHAARCGHGRREQHHMAIVAGEGHHRAATGRERDIRIIGQAAPETAIRIAYRRVAGADHADQGRAGVGNIVDRAAAAIPVRRDDEIAGIAIVGGVGCIVDNWRQQAADVVVGMAAHQRIGAGHDVLVALGGVVVQAASAAIDPAHGAGIDHTTNVEGGVGHHEVAVC